MLVVFDARVTGAMGHHVRLLGTVKNQTLLLLS